MKISSSRLLKEASMLVRARKAVLESGDWLTAAHKLVDLSSVSLRKLGVAREQLIDTEKNQYPVTRKWAMAIHGQCPQIQGLSWVSWQDDSARGGAFR